VADWIVAQIGITAIYNQWNKKVHAMFMQLEGHIENAIYNNGILPRGTLSSFNRKRGVVHPAVLKKFFNRII
jgi:hypothetical protein